MAIARPAKYCPICGKRISEIHRSHGKDFVGDNFVGYEAHQCDKNSEQYKNSLSEINRNEKLKCVLVDNKDLKKLIFEPTIESVDHPALTDEFDTTLRSIANSKTGIQHKIATIEKYLNELRKKVGGLEN